MGRIVLYKEVKEGEGRGGKGREGEGSGEREKRESPFISRKEG